MSVLLDLDRLLEGIGQTVYSKIMPALPEGGSARFHAAAIHELLIHALHRRAGDHAVPDHQMTLAMAQRIRALAECEPSAACEREMVATLNDDSRFYRDDAHLWRSRIAEVGKSESRVLPPPTDDELTQIGRSWSKDPYSRCRLVDCAVGGYSKQTVLFEHIAADATITPLAMRRDLPVSNLGPNERFTVIDEYPVLKEVFRMGLSVAEPLYIEPDPTVLKTAFLISRRVSGHIRGNSLGLGEASEVNPVQAIGTLLARIHTIDINDLDVPGFSYDDFGLKVQQTRIGDWARRYRENVVVPAAALEVGLAWLNANAHIVIGQTSLVHGDVGYHNIMFDGGRITALLDWELVHIGNPAEDLAYVRGMVSGFDDLMGAYVAGGGKMPTPNVLDYFELFGFVRNSVIAIICLKNFHDGLSDDVSMVRIILDSFYTYVDKISTKLTELINTNGFRLV